MGRRLLGDTFPMITFLLKCFWLFLSETHIITLTYTINGTKITQEELQQKDYKRKLTKIKLQMRGVPCSWDNFAS